MGAPWPDDLCRRCPHVDMCDLTDPCEAPEFTECQGVSDWRDGLEYMAEAQAERGKI